MLLFEGTFTSFFKGKKSKRCHKTVESRFFLLFIPVTNGSGSRRPKNTWIRWIRIRIRNTATYPVNLNKTVLKKLVLFFACSHLSSFRCLLDALTTRLDLIHYNCCLLPTWAVSVGVGGGGGGGRSPGTAAQHALQLHPIQPPQLYKCLISVVDQDSVGP